MNEFFAKQLLCIWLPVDVTCPYDLCLAHESVDAEHVRFTQN